MFPKGTVTAAVTPAEKPPVTAQKESTVVYMVDNADSQVNPVNDPYGRIQRARICACSVVLTTVILVAGTLGAIAIVLRHTNEMATTNPHQSINHDREPLLSNEVPLPKLPESTIRIKIDDGGLLPPREPTTPDLVAIDDVTNDITKPLPTVALPTTRIKIDEPATPDIIAVDDVTDDITEPLPAISLSSSGGDDSSSSSDRNYYGRNYISSSFPYDGYYMRGQEGIPPWDQSNWVGPSERARDETDLEVSGDDQEKDYESGEPDLEMTEEPDAPIISSISDALYWYYESSYNEPATPDIIAFDDVTDDITEPLPAISLSSSSGGDDWEESSDRNYYGRNYISSSFPYDGYYMRGQEGIPPWDQSNWVGPSERARDETGLEVSGDDQENDYESGEPDLEMTDETAAPSPDSNLGSLPSSSLFVSDTYDWRSVSSNRNSPYSSEQHYYVSE